ncbi:MAG TPA: hypothetical protein VN909_01855 [Candidatus Dormibacteraeota bacterium]|nr:hypothetical protein [Candidatus Dormibacteraeota bacterium]
MMTRSDCSLAETLAGAIAIGEAGDAERDSYRAHVAGCERCLQEFGGEREMERVMSAVRRARDDERWEPDIRKALVRRAAPRQAWRWGAALAAVVIAIGGAFSLEKRPQVAPPQHTISAGETRAIAAIGTQSAPRREGRAESLVVGSEAPLRTSFTLSMDGRGTPLHCAITKSSGDRALDRAVCAAALHVRYTRR